jgi:hypothetical protein
MEARADHEAGGQLLVRVFAADDRGPVVRAHAGGEAAVPLEVLLEFLRVHAFRIAIGACFGRSLNILAHSRSKSISSCATTWRSAE